jgi:hypothetical protein
MESSTSSRYIGSIAAERILVFNAHFEEGGAGIVATENLQTGIRGHPKGINMLALMASFLDPTMKGGAGISDVDKEIIDEKIRELITENSAVEVGHPHPHEQQQQDPAPVPHEKTNNNHRMTYLMRSTIITWMKT